MGRTVLLGCLVVLACGDTGNESVHTPWVPDARVENALAGDPGWRVTKPSRSREVEGYALRSTLAPGETLEVAASVSLPAAEVA
ncbi:MAG TPA: hypothetical protein VFE93_14805, partial [Myxococcaceae bacterium]|nr:hypothetical protein [Myxococcaceae bacterium]